MKRLLLHVFLFFSLHLSAQDTKPVANFKLLPTYSFSYHTADSSVWIYKGKDYRWTQLARSKDGWYAKILKGADTVILRIKSKDTLNIAKYMLHNDSLILSGYFTNWKALQYRKLNNHDSLSALDEKSYNSLTDKPTISTLGGVAKSDSISYVTPYRLLQSLPTGYELEIVTAGVTMFAVPFTLSSRTLVFYNGAVLSKNLWTGVGVTSLTLMLDTKQKDLLKIQNQ